ncbi:hypothetical protein [Streptomyces cucumeris]
MSSPRPTLRRPAADDSPGPTTTWFAQVRAAPDTLSTIDEERGPRV